MATAQNLIDVALRHLGALGIGESPSTAEGSEALTALQYMLQSWSAEGLTLWFVTNENFALSASPSTIGSGGTFNTVRPEKILSAYLRDSYGTDYHLNIIDYDRWSRISLKSLVSTPGYLYYAPEYPLGKVYIYPNGTGTLYLDSLKPLTVPSLVGSSVSFPEEYNNAIAWNLAFELFASYGKSANLELISKRAQETKDVLKSKNFESRIVAARPEIIHISGRYNIDGDQ